MFGLSERMRSIFNNMHFFRAEQCVKQDFLMLWRSAFVIFSHNEENGHSELFCFRQEVIEKPYL